MGTRWWFNKEALDEDNDEVDEDGDEDKLAPNAAEAFCLLLLLLLFMAAAAAAAKNELPERYCW